MYGRSIGTQKGPVIDMWPKMEFRLSNCSIQETCHPLPTSLKNPRSARLSVWSKVYSDKPSRCFCKLWLSIAARFGSSLYKQNFTLMIHYYNSIKVEARRLKIKLLIVYFAWNCNYSEMIKSGVNLISNSIGWDGYALTVPNEPRN